MLPKVGKRDRGLIKNGHGKMVEGSSQKKSSSTAGKGEEAKGHYFDLTDARGARRNVNGGKKSSVGLEQSKQRHF